MRIIVTIVIIAAAVAEIVRIPIVIASRAVARLHYTLYDNLLSEVNIKHETKW